MVRVQGPHVENKKGPGLAQVRDDDLRWSQNIRRWFWVPFVHSALLFHHTHPTRIPLPDPVSTSRLIMLRSSDRPGIDIFIPNTS